MFGITTNHVSAPNIWNELLRPLPVPHPSFVWCTNGGRKNESAAGTTTSPLPSRPSRPSQAAVKKMKKILNRAMAYVIGYLLAYFFSTFYRLMVHWVGTVPFAIIIAKFWFPLQVNSKYLSIT